jgi:hypothetical protein
MESYGVGFVYIKSIALCVETLTVNGVVEGQKPLDIQVALSSSIRKIHSLLATSGQEHGKRRRVRSISICN